MPMYLFVLIISFQARDEKGRKRLHGAFTGGFSAGYFNTVGSKEGLSLFYVKIDFNLVDVLFRF